MAIGPIELNGAISRTQDYALMRGAEEGRPAAEQNAITHNQERTTQEKFSQVTDMEEVGKQELHHDAREQGNGHYAGDGGRNRKKQDEKQEGRVVLKQSGFDVKI